MIAAIVAAIVLSLAALAVGIAALVLVNQHPRGPRGRRGFTGPTGAEASESLLLSTITITGTQILNLRTGGVQILPPLPTGFTYLIFGATLDAQLNSQLASGEDLGLRYIGATDPFGSIGGSKPFLTSTAPIHMLGTFTVTQQTGPDVPDLPGAGVLLTVSSTNFTGGTNNSVTITLYYSIVPISS